MTVAYKTKHRCLSRAQESLIFHFAPSNPASWGCLWFTRQAGYSATLPGSHDLLPLPGGSFPLTQPLPTRTDHPAKWIRLQAAIPKTQLKNLCEEFAHRPLSPCFAFHCDPPGHTSRHTRPNSLLCENQGKSFPTPSRSSPLSNCTHHPLQLLCRPALAGEQGERPVLTWMPLLPPHLVKLHHFPRLFPCFLPPHSCIKFTLWDQQ